MRITMIGLLLGATLLVACDDSASTSTTSTTSAKEDLKQAGRDLGSATQKAAVEAGHAAKEEAKKEVHELDVHLTTSAADGGGW